MISTKVRKEVTSEKGMREMPCGRDTPGSSAVHVMFVSFFFFLIYFWQCWVFVSVRGLSLVAASGGHSSLRCAGLSPSRPLLLRSTGSRRVGSVIVAHGPKLLRGMWDPPRPGLEPVSHCIGRQTPNHCATREALLFVS